MKTNLRVRGVACLPWYLGCLQDVLVVVVVVVFVVVLVAVFDIVVILMQLSLSILFLVLLLHPVCWLVGLFFSFSRRFLRHFPCRLSGQMILFLHS